MEMYLICLDTFAKNFQHCLICPNLIQTFQSGLFVRRVVDCLQVIGEGLLVFCQRMHRHYGFPDTAQAIPQSCPMIFRFSSLSPFFLFLAILFLLCYLYSITLRTSFTEKVEQALPHRKMGRLAD